MPLLKQLTEHDMVGLSTATLVSGPAIHSKLDAPASAYEDRLAAFLVVGLLFTVYSLYSDAVAKAKGGMSNASNGKCPCRASDLEFLSPLHAIHPEAGRWDC